MSLQVGGDGLFGTDNTPAMFDDVSDPARPEYATCRDPVLDKIRGWQFANPILDDAPPSQQGIFRGFSSLRCVCDPTD